MIRGRAHRSIRFLSTILIPALLLAGCSPNVASPDAQPSAKGDSKSTSAVPQEGSSFVSGGANPGDLMGAENIEQTLNEMPPDERTTVILRFVSFALLYFYTVYKRYPTAEEGLAILLNPPPAPDGTKKEPFARDILLLDQWGRKVHYVPTPFPNGLPGFKLSSLGPDGVVSGDDLVPDVEQVTMETSAIIAQGGLDSYKGAEEAGGALIKPPTP